MDTHSRRGLSLVFLLLAAIRGIHLGSAFSPNVTNIYRDYLDNLAAGTNESAPPCENFFQHACGSAAEETQRMHPLLYNHQDYYDFFESHREMFTTQSGTLVRQLYDLCKDARRSKSSVRRSWLRMISEVPFLQGDVELLRRWPFLEYQWQKYEQQLLLSWPTLAAEFAAHGLEVFFNIFFAEDTIYITPNRDFLCPAHEDIRQSLLPLLRKRNSQIADIVGGELWQLCRQLKGDIPLSREVETVADFLSDATMTDFMQRFFPRLNLTDEDIEHARKIVVDVERLSEVMSGLKSSNPRIVYNFVLWHAFQQLEAIDDCFQLTDEFSSLLHVEYWHWSAFEGHLSRDVALATYVFHTTRFQRSYRRAIASSSLERMFQPPSQRKELNIEKSLRNFTKEHLNQDRYDMVYQSPLLDSDQSSFYFSLLEMRRLSLRYSFYNSYVDKEDLNFFREFLNFCILLQYRPRFHYFASYDRDMWLDSGVLYSSDGLFSALDCLEKQNRLNADDYPELYTNMREEQDVRATFNFYTSFTQSMADYKFWLESENFALAEDFILEYFHLDSERIMFYAVAQQFCGRNDPLYSTVINRAFMNMPEFEQAFECSGIDPMNPATKCVMQRT